MLCICPSIQPKQSASSNASFAVIVLGLPCLPNKSQTPSVERQFAVSQSRNSALSENINVFFIIFTFLNYQKWVKESDSENRAQIEQYKAELKKLESQKARLVSLALDGILSPIETKEQKENIERKIAAIEPKLNSMLDRYIPSKKELIEFMEYTRQRLLDGTYEDYEELLRAHIEKVEVFPDHQVITLIKVPYLSAPETNFEVGGDPLKTVSDSKTSAFGIIYFANVATFKTFGISHN